jgi:hypothetical protein
MAYVVSFSSLEGNWQSLEFKPQDFRPLYRGRLVTDAPPLSFADAKQIGFMLADKKPGSFQLAIKQMSQ